MHKSPLAVLFAATAALAPGCKKHVEAPADIEDLVVFGLDHFDDDPAYLQATDHNLEPLVEEKQDDMADGLKVTDLTAEDLAETGVPDATVDSIIGALGSVTYVHDVDQVADVLTLEQKVGIFPQTVEYDLGDHTDRACFVAHGCDRIDQTVHDVEHVAFLGDSARDYTTTFRWITRDDGQVMVFQRTLDPTGITFENAGIIVVHQQYSFVAIYPAADGLRRVESFWVDADVVGVDVPQSFAVTQAVKQMASAAEDVDTVIDTLHDTGTGDTGGGDTGAAN